MPVLNPLFDLRSYQDWDAARGVFKKGATRWYRPSRLAPVNKALKLYFQGPSMRRRLAVDDAIHRVRRESRAAYNKYEELLMWLYKEMERRHPHTLPNTGNPVLSRLNEMCQYAVTDLPSFPGNINKGHVGRVWNRYYQMTQAELAQDGQAGARVRLKFDTQAIRSAAQFVKAGRCGCCTTFAARAADIMLKGLTQRVEIVAVPAAGRVAHCFVILGRHGDATGGHLPLPNSGAWGTNFWVVDPWLAALGFDCVYPNGVGFPQNWLTGSFKLGTGAGLEQKFDSANTAGALSAADLAAQMQGRLKKVTTKESNGAAVGRVL